MTDLRWCVGVGCGGFKDVSLLLLVYSSCMLLLSSGCIFSFLHSPLRFYRLPPSTLSATSGDNTFMATIPATAENGPDPLVKALSRHREFPLKSDSTPFEATLFSSSVRVAAKSSEEEKEYLPWTVEVRRRAPLLPATSSSRSTSAATRLRRLNNIIRRRMLLFPCPTALLENRRSLKAFTAPVLNIPPCRSRRR